MSCLQTGCRSGIGEKWMPIGTAEQFDAAASYNFHCSENQFRICMSFRSASARAKRLAFFSVALEPFPVETAEDNSHQACLRSSCAPPATCSDVFVSDPSELPYVIAFVEAAVNSIPHVCAVCPLLHRSDFIFE